MVLKDSSATTLENYIVKIVEAVLVDSEKSSLTLVEICEQIDSQFALTFGADEVKAALSKKKTGRILLENGLYSISAKAKLQLSSNVGPLDSLRHYISEYEKISNKNFDNGVFLENLLKYLYHCFNSTTKNLITLLQNKIIIENEASSFSNDEILLINDFIAWDYSPKNELFYKIIASSYAYCMLTTKQDQMLSRKIFHGKRFFLDSNIIFRMAGINKEERKYVTNSFVKKCSEVGIELCYTNETLGELYRVINAHIRYIINLTQGQAPVNSYLIQRMRNNVEPNDFYDIYYNWTKTQGNNFNDYESFQKYLIGMVTDSLSELKLVTIKNYSLQNDNSFNSSYCDLEKFKSSKRPSKLITSESLQTDMNNIFHTLTARKKSQANTLWQTNDFVVSADQLLIAWAEQTYPGIPLVVIPSTWLSIILRFSGRTQDDYKSYCLFMSLRQHQVSPDDVQMNPIQIMTELSQKTNDVILKEKIITELISNKKGYDFSEDSSYSTAIDKAFDVVLSKMESEKENHLVSVTENLHIQFAHDKSIIEKQLETLSSEQEYIMKYAQNKATRKIDFFKRISFLQIILPFIGIVFMVLAIFAYSCRWVFVYELSTKLGPFVSIAATIIMTALPTAISGLLKYLSSDDRRTALVKKYSLEAERNMKYK